MGTTFQKSWTSSYGTLPGLLSHSPLFMVPRVKLEYRFYLVKRLFDSNHLGWREQKRSTSAGDGGK
ncbi:unnamed protein product [Prunus armeniaca]|uniref:Uncharacterized protein n=1 Tax=Prunus armeniaca TaxID=36596 RepID=A0A6J5VFP5_PRUAR|nr:unnamed protein product [Prunus armeniaca]